MRRGFLAELGSLNGLIIVLLASLLVTATLYSRYIGPPGLGSATYMPRPSEAYRVLIEKYISLYLDSLSSSMVFIAPIASSISIALSIERGEERFLLVYSAYRRWRLYLQHSLSVALWLLTPSLLAYLLAPLSVSATYGYALLSLGLLEALPLVAVYVLFYSSLSTFASVVSGRVGTSILVGVVLGFLAGFLRANALYMLAASIIAYLGGYYVYSRRDL